MLDQLRKLGLVVEIDDSVIHLREPFTAATAGVALTPEQAKMLAHLEKRTVDFSIKMLRYWQAYIKPHIGVLERISCY